MEGNWSRSFRYWLLTLLVVIFALLAWYVRNAISPLVIAALIAYVLTPVVDFLNQRAKIPRGLSATIIILLGFGAIVSLPALMIPTLLAEVETLAADLEDIFLAIQAFLGRPIEFLGFELHLEQLEMRPLRIAEHAVPRDAARTRRQRAPAEFIERLDPLEQRPGGTMQARLDSGGTHRRRQHQRHVPFDRRHHRERAIARALTRIRAQSHFEPKERSRPHGGLRFQRASPANALSARRHHIPTGTVTCNLDPAAGEGQPGG